MVNLYLSNDDLQEMLPSSISFENFLNGKFVYKMFVIGLKKWDHIQLKWEREVCLFIDA